jgi:hypothetical protein
MSHPPDASISGRSRQDLAAAGTQQTQQLLAAAHSLLEAFGGGGSAETGQRAALQERYLAVVDALRETLTQCAALERQEAAAATAGAVAAQQRQQGPGKRGSEGREMQGRRGGARLLGHFPECASIPAPSCDLFMHLPMCAHPLPHCPAPRCKEDPEVAALMARAAELRARLEEKNAIIKAAIDRLRALLDALCMWDSSRRELAAAVG